MPARLGQEVPARLGPDRAELRGVEDAAGVAPVPRARSGNATAGTTASGVFQPLQSWSSPSSNTDSSVFTAPGRSALIAMPWSTSSGASAVENRSIAAFATA